jgi:hypothetical protein
VDPAYVLSLNANFAPLATAFFGHHCVTVFDGLGTLQQPLPPPRQPRSGLLFSGGVDSFYSLAKMREFEALPDYLINVSAGAHKNPPSTEARRANIAQLAAKLNLPLILLDTNFHELFVEEHVRCHPIRNLCACFALRPWIEVLCYSGAHAYREVSFAEAARLGDISYVEQIDVAGMTPRDLQVLYVGCDATRIEKTKAIATDPLAQGHLDVCSDTAYQARLQAGTPMNCGECTKCVRTIITLDHFGYLDAFAGRFDLTRYRNDRVALVDFLLRGGVPLDETAAALANVPRAKLMVRNARRVLRSAPIIGPIIGILARSWRAFR